MYLDLAFHTADQVSTVGARGNHAGQRLSVLGDNNSFWIQVLQQGETLFLKFGSVNGLHFK